jgi:PAS domain-containing protein
MEQAHSIQHQPDAVQAAALDVQSLALSAEALLREHPDALVCGLAGNGLIVPVPQTIGLWGQGLIEGRALIDHVVASDRITVTRVWIRAQEEGAASAKIRLTSRPETWTTLHFLDVRELHGVLLGVIIPSSEEADECEELADHALARPRFCSLQEDESAKVLGCDDAFTAMFGYTLEELLGKSVLDQIHPEDQGRPPTATSRRVCAASARTTHGCGWTPRCATTSTSRDATTCWWR